MPTPLKRKMTVGDLREARSSRRMLPMLTCYDYSTARQMQEAGVPGLLVGDSAASVILGHDTTLPISLDFMIELTAAVRRGAPLALLMADMPFGSYQASDAEGVANVCRMVQRTGCDCVKLEVAESHLPLIRRLADAGIAVVAHLGLRPQWVGLVGGYRYQGRTAREAEQLLALSLQMQRAGAAAILLEAVPPEVAKAVVDATEVPIIGCGSGPDCHACVFVTHDAIGLTPHKPRFVPELGDVASELRRWFGLYVDSVADGRYPAGEHSYAMPPEELQRFLNRGRQSDNPRAGDEDL